MEAAARRELLEETGYEARQMTALTAGVASAGLCDEVIQMMRATGLKKVAAGGGEPGEQITVHEVPLEEVEGWLAERRKEGTLLDLKIYGALYFARLPAG
jgi:ADP-ribose pyrophosphatase